ncbi:MAG: TIGR00725 family protein [Thermodesulfovibrionales bacterium]
MSTRKPIIAVVGGRAAPDDCLAIAEEVGRCIARRGAILICGGLEGVMEAASKGAQGEGGITVGVLPQDTRVACNPFIDVPISTGLGVGRNVIIARSADALIAIGGEYGTLSEIAFALQMKKPVIGIKTWSIRGVVESESAEEAVKKVFALL